MHRTIRTSLMLATALSLACPSGARDPHSPSAGDAALRVKIAQLEAKRGAGVGELVELARHGKGEERTLAVRGLGRIGGTEARAVLDEMLADGDGAVVAHAAAAIGVAASLADEASPDARVAQSKKLVDALARATPKAAVIEAIGRAGDPATAGGMLAELAKAGADREVALLAFGRWGRRKLKWTTGHAEVIASTSDADVKVRYAAAYALARETEPGTDAAAEKALLARLDDADAEVAAVAISGLARRKLAEANRSAIASKVRDRDWRVAVEAVRALPTDQLVAVDAAKAYQLASAHMPGGGHQPLLELLHDWSDAKVPDEASHALLRELPALSQYPSKDLDDAWTQCLFQAAMHVAPEEKSCAALSRPLRMGLAIDAWSQDPRAHIGNLLPLMTDTDPRVQAAALATAPSLFHIAELESTIVQLVATETSSPNVVVRSAATDAIEKIYPDAGNEQQRSMQAAVITQAQAETEQELAASMLELIGKLKMSYGVDVCRGALGKAPVIARAGASCLKALGEAAPAQEPTAAQPPPVEVAAVIGKRVRWHLATTRGEVVIELRPDVAPWAVAAIATLTQKHFYDHLEFHRVVPDFVVQGGDPTQTGVGGPDFSLPAEPGTVLDGAGFVTGGIGLADSGPDSAGSQYFAMHSRAPHLDGRYTWVGQVVSGQNVADSLEIGDRVETATIEVQ